MQCQCEICDRKYQYSRTSGHTTKKCNSCMVNTRRFNLKIKMIDYKGNSCVNCGYSKCTQSLCFHHLNPSTKSFDLSGSHARSWRSIQKELDKCILLCQNCHGELHAGIWSPTVKA